VFSVCNVALNLPSYQSSVYKKDDSYDAYRCNDGKISNTHYAHCCISETETNPWWAVDLGVPLSVQEVFLTNRGDHAGSM